MHSERFDRVSPLPKNLPAPARFLSGSLFAPRLLCRAGPAKNALRQIAHRRFPVLPRRTPRAFLAAVTVITEQTRDRIPAAKEVNLKTVSLFLGARFRVDAPDVLFRIGISSFFHLLHSRLRRQDCKRLNALFSMTSAAANASPAISGRNRSAARARNRDAAPLAST